MALKQISTDKAPSAIGPYSQGIVANGFLFTAGQIALDPVAGKIVEGGIVEQTERVMQNLQEVLRAAGASWGDVVKTTVYLHDLAHFPTVNEIYGKWLGQGAASEVDGSGSRIAARRPGRDRRDRGRVFEVILTDRMSTSRTREELFRLTEFASCAG